MKMFIRKPDIALYPGVIVTKDTVLEYSSERVTQTLKDLEFHSVTRVEGDTYASTYDTTITLSEGDILIFEEGGRGYIKPAEGVQTVKEAIEDLECIKEIGNNDCN